MALLVAIALAGSAHGFLHHHHESQTEEQDCALCNFHHNVSFSNLSAIVPDLTPVFFLLFLFIPPRTPFKPQAFSVHPGRAPPAIPHIL